MAPERLHNPGARVSRMAPRAFFDFARAATVIPRLLSLSLLGAEGIRWPHRLPYTDGDAGRFAHTP